MQSRHSIDEPIEPKDWETIRQLGHQMVDDMLDLLEHIRNEPVWRELPEAEKDYFNTPVPQLGKGAEAAYSDFKTHVLPYRMGNIHPRFWGWVMGSGTPLAMLADMLASGMNSNLGGGDHSAVYVEYQVINWMKELFGYPSEASGLLTSGGSMANLIGLTVARNRRAGFDVRLEGLAAAPTPLVCYASTQVHSSVHKAVELLGLGRQALREIPVDDQFSLRVDLLEQAIQADRAAGLQPLCVVGNAGTTNTGAFDNLEALADLCERENLWFHVDGAFGAWVAIVPELQPRVRGMERADSLAFDLHKWGYMPFEVGCTLVRSPEDHRRAFSLTPDYLSHTSRGPAAGETWLSDYGVQLTRGFRALKVWLSMKAHGSAAFGELIARNVQQAHELQAIIDQQPELELLAPVTLNIVCFRYLPTGLSGEALNAFNQELLLRLQESGVALPSYTTLDGRYALRVNITNHRTESADLQVLIDKVLALGQELDAERAAA